MKNRLEKAKRKSILEDAAVLLAMFLAIGVISISARWLIVGQTWTGIPEVPIGQDLALNQRIVSTVPYPPAIVSMGAAMLILAGLVMSRQPVAWIGLAVLVIFSFLFLFSSGAALLPVDLLLLILFLLIMKARRESHSIDRITRTSSR